MKLIGVFLLVEASVTGAQSLLEAIARHSQFSEFHDLLNATPRAAAASGLLSNSSSGSEQQTILVPNNNAFDNYRRATGRNISSLSSPDLEDTLNYHSLQGALSSADIQNPRGLLSNTALKNPDRDNRGLDSNGAKKPQVVLITPGGAADGSRIKVRDAGGVNVKSGKGQEITLDPAPGKWSGGIFYMVDGSVIALLFVFRHGQNQLSI